MSTFTKLILPITAMILLGFSSICQASVAPTATLSGTVTYNGSKTGRVYLVANGGSSGSYSLWNVGVSTTLTGSSGSYSGSFTIRGAGIGGYPVKAYLDSTGTGIQHDSDPAGIIYLPNVTGDTTGINITLTDPTPATLAAPTNVGAIIAQNNTANLVNWSPPRNSSGLEIPVKYNIYWSSAGSDASIVSSKLNIPANGNGMWIHAGATTAYYYKVVAVSSTGSTETSGWTQAGSLPSGSYSISGTVTYTGVTPTNKPLGLAALDENGRPYFVGYANPAANSQSFTIPNLPAGKYGIQGFIDMNNNGIDDAGDLRIKESAGVRVTITNANLSGIAVNLPTTNAVLQARTSHTLYGETGADNSGEQFQYRLLVTPQLKTPINAALTSAPSSGSGYVVTPVDLGNSYENGRLELNIQNLKKAQAGDSYTVTVYYLEGGSDAYTVLTTAPYNSPPWPLAPIFPVPYNDLTKGTTNGSPVFSWLPPATPPGTWYSYAIWLQDINYNQLFSTDNLASTITSYNTSDDGFTLPTATGAYGWTLTAMDANDNEIQYQAGFVTAQSAPLITGISPASVVPGGTLTIKGYNLAGPTSVTVGGTPLSVTSSTSTQITATVPGGFGGPSNPLVVTTTAGTYTWGPAGYYGAPLSLGSATTHSGQVVDNAGTPISGVTVTMVGNPSITTTTDSSGNFTLNNLPNSTATPFSLRFMVSGKQPHYTKKMGMSAGSSTTASFPYKMRTYAELNSLSGMTTPGKGAVSTRVLVQGTSTPIDGATVTAVGSSGTTYVAQYYNGTNYTGTSTSTAGGGVVLFANVNHGDKLTINASAPGYTFSSISSTGVAEASTSGGIGGVVAAPTVSGFTPGSGAVGASITITGTSFINVTNVTFGGVQAISFTVNSPTQITATVPVGALSGVIGVTTATGSASSSSSFTVVTPYTLTVTLSGYGTGTVTSNTGGINCPGTCTAQINSGTSVTLTATPHLPESSFGGWSGACSAEPCTFTMSSDKTAITTFSLKQLKNITLTTYYDTLLEALTNAANGNEVRAHDSLQAPSLSYNRANITVKIAGGYDNAFALRNSPSTTYTDITSPLTVQAGTLILDQIVVK